MKYMLRRPQMNWEKGRKKKKKKKMKYAVDDCKLNFLFGNLLECYLQVK
jgi:hypothetical protein